MLDFIDWTVNGFLQHESIVMPLDRILLLLKNSFSFEILNSLYEYFDYVIYRKDEKEELQAIPTDELEIVLRSIGIDQQVI